ncbi:MAG: hypothetical protein ABIN58_01240 [candidate division WOR-3 bacterium]
MRIRPTRMELCLFLRPEPSLSAIVQIRLNLLVQSEKFGIREFFDIGKIGFDQFSKTPV